MARTDEIPTAPAPGATTPFEDILCAVDGSRGSSEAVRQAIALAAPAGRIAFLSVTDVRGVGANRVAGVGEHRAEQALAGAKAMARDAGLHCTTELVHAPIPAEEILARQAGHDLLVAGCHPETRPGGIMTGSMATTLAHRTSGPLLIARAPRWPRPLGERIVLAVDGRSEAAAVSNLCLRLAKLFDAHVDVAHATNGGVHGRGVLGAIAADLWLATGREPLVTEVQGDPADVIVEVVERDEAGLLIVGHGGRSGLRALGSVSEQLVHRAPCSVLVVPA